MLVCHSWLPWPPVSFFHLLFFRVSCYLSASIFQFLSSLSFTLFSISFFTWITACKVSFGLFRNSRTWVGVIFSRHSAFMWHWFRVGCLCFLAPSVQLCQILIPRSNHLVATSALGLFAFSSTLSCLECMWNSDTRLALGCSKGERIQWQQTMVPSLHQISLTPSL